MKTCANPNCRQPLDDNAQFCPNCGMPCSGQSAPNFMQPDPFDHTAEFLRITCENGANPL